MDVVLGTQAVVLPVTPASTQCRALGDLECDRHVAQMLPRTRSRMSLTAVLQLDIAIAAAAAGAGAAAATASSNAASGVLTVDVAADFSYTVRLGGEVWLYSSPTRAYFDHTEHPNPAKDGTAITSSGSDEIGSFTSTTQHYTAGSTQFSTAVKSYASLDVAVFEVHVPGGAIGTNASVPAVPGGWPGPHGNVKPIVAFPAFATDAAATGHGTGPGLASLKLQQWEDNFCYSSHGPALSWQGNKSTSKLGQGMFGGPLVLHDTKNLTADASLSLTTLVVAPLDNLKHHGSFRNDTTSSSWELGVYSQITSLPTNFTHRTLLLGGAGVTATVEKYGALVQRLAQTNKTEAMSKDLVVNKLGYWTDSGAFYYGDIPFNHNLSAMAATYKVLPNMQCPDAVRTMSWQCSPPAW